VIDTPPEAPRARSPAEESGPGEVHALRTRVRELEARLQQNENRRRAMVHIMADLAESNRLLSDHRKAMLHILQDAHESNQRLGRSRKAMIHIMGDLRRTTEEISRREQELREKQAQLVQAAKLATLGELTTGIAHELNNPLNNIGLYLGNLLDLESAGRSEPDRTVHDLTEAIQQVQKATEIISHLRTFGRAAPTERQPVGVNEVILRSVALLREQLRLRQVEVRLSLDGGEPRVMGNPIQLEQVLMNLLTNARDAVANARIREISVRSSVEGANVRLQVSDTGPGIPVGLEQRIFDPFFTTKDVGEGTGLGLSIVYGIIKEHQGTIALDSSDLGGASFVIHLPMAGPVQ
jgi:C4-dicarboxylate-specific signal transduction histidine kinase